MWTFKRNEYPLNTLGSRKRPKCILGMMFKSASKLNFTLDEISPIVHKDFNRRTSTSYKPPESVQKSISIQRTKHFYNVSKIVLKKSPNLPHVPIHPTFPYFIDPDNRKDVIVMFYHNIDILISSYKKVKIANA